jgi:hypothetical protein
MAFDGSIMLALGDEERLFRLGIDQILSLEEKRDSAVAAIYGRLMHQAWFLADVTEVIRLGLIGGGTEVRVAKALVERHCEPGSLDTAALLAFHILATTLDAPKAWQVLGKQPTAGDASEATSASPPPSSTAPA